MHLVQRLPHDVVFRPVHRGTSHDILGLRDWGKRRLVRNGTFDLCGVLSHAILFYGVALCAFTRGQISNVGEGRGEHVARFAGSLLALLLERAHKGMRVLDGGGLEVFQGLEVALALLPLELQQRDGGAQCYRVGVLALGDGHRGRLLSEGCSRQGLRWRDTWSCILRFGAGELCSGNSRCDGRHRRAAGRLRLGAALGALVGRGGGDAGRGRRGARIEHQRWHGGGVVVGWCWCCLWASICGSRGVERLAAGRGKSTHRRVVWSALVCTALPSRPALRLSRFLRTVASKDRRRARKTSLGSASRRLVGLYSVSLSSCHFDFPWALHVGGLRGATCPDGASATSELELEADDLEKQAP